MMKRLEHLSYEETLRLEQFSLEKRRFKEDFINVHRKGIHKKKRVSFPVLLSDRTRGRIH